MATPPPSRDSTLHDIHDDADDTSSHGNVTGKEKEMGQCVVGGDMKGLVSESASGLKICRIDPASWDKKIGTTLSRNMLPKQQANHQVEVDVPSIKQETNRHSSLVKGDIPINTEATVLTNAPGVRITHIREETPPIENFDYEEFFETLNVSNASQLFSLPHNLQSLTIKGCESLDVLPNDLLDGLNFLTELELIDCSSLRSIPYVASLTNLYIRNCRNFELFPSLESRQKLLYVFFFPCDSDIK